MKNDELENFNIAMEKLLNANPKIVRAAMEKEKQERKKGRDTKRLSSDPVPSDQRI